MSLIATLLVSLIYSQIYSENKSNENKIKELETKIELIKKEENKNKKAVQNDY